MTDTEFKAYMYEHIKSNFAFQISAKPANWLITYRQGLRDMCAKQKWPVDDFNAELAAIDEQLAMKE